MRRLVINIMLAGTLLFTGSAVANHDDDNQGMDHRYPGGGGGNLSSAVSQLQNAVSYSSLAYHVQNAVNNFAQYAYRYQSCVNGGYSVTDHRDGGGWDGGGRYRCDSYRQNMRYSFQQVSNYLYDTSWDHPQVYNAWRNVQYLMQQY